jgi:outer membrane protein OmpU
MKKILLSSAAIALLAGAASAEISWSGAGTLGYNDDWEGGVFVDVDVDITGTAELNNGWTASLTYGLELDDNGEQFDQTPPKYEDNDDSFDDNLTLTLSNDMIALTYGDTEYAAVSYWSGVSEMATDGFSEVDGEAVLKVSGKFGMVEGAASVLIAEDDYNATVTGGETYQASLGLAATFGMVDVTLGYQEEALDAATYVQDAAYYDNGDFNGNEIFAISAAASFAGVDVTAAYSKDNTADEDSLGLEVSYPVGPVTLGAFYVSESLPGDTYGVSALYSDGPLTAKVYYKEILSSEEYGLGATYDMGTGLTLTGGYIDGDSVSDDDFAGYVVAEYDLGGGASFLASYADANNAKAAMTDDVDTVTGGYELRSGATLALTLKF